MTTTNSCKRPVMAVASLVLLLLTISCTSPTMAQDSPAPTPTTPQTPQAPVEANQTSPAPAQTTPQTSPAPALASPVQVGSPEPSQTPSVEPTKSPITPPPTRTTPDCFTSLTDLFEIMELASPFVDKEYILCPNTNFDVGFHDEFGECCTRGQLTFYTKSKTHIKCGEDGKSTNNCVIRGGTFQLMIGPQIFEETATTDVKLSGITWESSTDTGIIIGSQGDITFVDNIIRGHMNRGPVVLFYIPPSEDQVRRLRKLFNDLPDTPRGRAEYYMNNPQAIEDWIREYVTIAEEAQESGMVLDYEGRGSSGGIGGAGGGDLRQRQLQPGFELVIKFIDCQFYNNSQGQVAGLTQQGIVTALTEFVPLTFQNCTFTNNTYTGVENRNDGYLVKTGGSRLNVSDTCVYSNNLTGFGSFQQYNDGPFESTNNFAYQNGYSSYFCQFIAVSAVESPDNPGQIKCIEPERTECNGVIAMTSPSPETSAAAASPATWSMSSLYAAGLMLIPTVVAQMALFGI